MCGIKEVNWLKVSANAGVAFFNAVIPLMLFDSLMDWGIGINDLVMASFAIGALYAGLAFCKEIIVEVEQPPAISKRVGESRHSAIKATKASTGGKGSKQIKNRLGLFLLF